MYPRPMSAAIWLKYFLITNRKYHFFTPDPIKSDFIIWHEKKDSCDHQIAKVLYISLIMSIKSDLILFYINSSKSPSFSFANTFLTIGFLSGIQSLAIPNIFSLITHCSQVSSICWLIRVLT